MNSKQLVSTLLCLSQLTFAVSSGVVEQKLRSSREPDTALKLAMSESNPETAKTAFAYYINQTKDTGSKKTLDAILKFSQKRGMFFPVAHLISTTDLYGKFADSLSQSPATGARQLAAAVLCNKALSSYLMDQKKSDIVKTTAEGEAAPVTIDLSGGGQSDDKKGKKKKGKKSKSKKGKGPVKGNFAPPTIQLKIADALFKADPVTQQNAILAAAYSKNRKYQTAVTGVETQQPGILSARLLFNALTTGTMNATQAETLYLTKSPVPVISKVSPELAKFSLNIPHQVFLCEAIRATKDTTGISILKKALFHPDIRVRVEAARALQVISSDEVVEAITTRFKSAQWPVAVELTRVMAKQPRQAYIEPLINRLAVEKGRLRQDINYALSTIMGKQKYTNYERWHKWWEEDGCTFTIDPEDSENFRKSKPFSQIYAAGNGSFYNTVIYSDRFCYVIDSSKSMKGDRIKSLTENTVQTIETQKPHCMYNIVDFGGDLIKMSKYLVKDKNKGIQHIKNMPLTFATRSYDALEYGALTPGIDTIYFLTDGAPVWGQINDWNKINSALLVMNRFRPLAVSAISFDPSEKQTQGMSKFVNYHNGSLEDIMLHSDGGDKPEKDPGQKKKKKKKK